MAEVNVARFVGDPCGYRYEPRAFLPPTGALVQAERGLTGEFVRINLAQAYLIEEEDNAPAAPVAGSTAGASTTGG